MLAGMPCTIEIAPIAVPVENNVKSPNNAPATGMNMIRQSIKLLTKIAPVKEAKSLFSIRVWLTWLEIVFASSVVNGTKVPAKVTTTERINMKIKE